MRIQNILEPCLPGHSQLISGLTCTRAFSTGNSEKPVATLYCHRFTNNSCRARQSIETNECNVIVYRRNQLEAIKVTSAIKSEISRSNRNLLTTNVIVFVMLVLAFAVSNRYWYNFFCGPFSITKEALLKADNCRKLYKYYVVVNGDGTLDPNYGERARNQRGDGIDATAVDPRKVSDAGSRFIFLKLDDQYLLIKGEGKEIPKAKSYEGSLEAIPTFTETNLIQPLYKRDAKLAGHIKPFMLDIRGFTAGGHVGLFLAGTLLLFLGWGFIVYTRRVTDPDSHPIIQELRKVGSDPQETMADIDADISSPQCINLGSLLVGDRWLVSKGLFDLRFVPIEKITGVTIENRAAMGNSLVVVTAHQKQMFDGQRQNIESAIDALTKKSAQIQRIPPKLRSGFLMWGQ